MDTVPGTGQALNTFLESQAPKRELWGPQGCGGPRSPAGPGRPGDRAAKASGASFSSFPTAKSSGQRQAHGPRADRRAGRRGRAGGYGEKEGHCLPKPNQGARATMQGILSGETDMPFFPPTAANTAHWI